MSERVFQQKCMVAGNKIALTLVSRIFFAEKPFAFMFFAERTPYQEMSNLFANGSEYENLLFYSPVNCRTCSSSC
jgi:hypothetical protein